MTTRGGLRGHSGIGYVATRGNGDGTRVVRVQEVVRCHAVPCCGKGMDHSRILLLDSVVVEVGGARFKSGGYARDACSVRRFRTEVWIRRRLRSWVSSISTVFMSASVFAALTACRTGKGQRAHDWFGRSAVGRSQRRVGWIIKKEAPGSNRCGTVAIDAARSPPVRHVRSLGDRGAGWGRPGVVCSSHCWSAAGSPRRASTRNRPVRRVGTRRRRKRPTCPACPAG